MKIAFDIGGVLSKYPTEFKTIIERFLDDDYDKVFCMNAGGECQYYPDSSNIYVITDQHPKEQVLSILHNNGFDYLKLENIYCADYSKYGEMCKAVLLKDLKIDIFIDDFPGYLNWNYGWGQPPLRLFVWPDASRSYHHKDWIQDKEYSFGKERWDIDG